MGDIAVIARTKLRILRHAVAGLKKHSRLKVAVVVGFGIVYLCGSYFLFRGAFHFMERFLPGLGHLLINRLFYLFFLAIFVMLVFSNMILVYSLAYRSKEVDFLTAAPVRHSSIFKWKFAEAMFFGSWASLFLVGPLILAYGIDHGAPIGYYLSVPAFLLPFVAMAAGIGGMLMVVLVKFLPRKKHIVGLIAAAALIAIIPTLMPDQVNDSSKEDILQSPLPVIDSMMRFAKLSRNPLFPSTWLVKGLLLETREHPEATPWPEDRLMGMGMLWSNALMSLVICFFLAKQFFYSGWSRSKSAGQRRTAGPTGDLTGKLSFLWRFAGRPVRAMVTKDIKVFWRNPAQWSQFVIFFGLLGVYILNLRNLSYHRFPPFFKNMISFMNLAATALTLGTLTTRFVFPQVSLEGNKFWVVGLAPIPVEKILLEKFLLCFISSTILAGGLTLLSGLMLGLDWPTVVISSVAMLLMCFGLSGLSVGLGALFPNFASDNPARIVSGFGGTLALVLSLAYITIVLTSEGLINHMQLTGQMRVPGVFWQCVVLGVATVGFTIVAGTLPMSLGAKHLNTAEF